MGGMVVPQVEGSVCDRILRHIFLSGAHALVIGDGLDVLLQERHSDLRADEIQEGLDVLRHDRFVTFRRTPFDACEYRLTGAGMSRAAQLFGTTNPSEVDEGARVSLW